MRLTIRTAVAALVLAFTFTAGWLASAQTQAIPRIQPPLATPQQTPPETVLAGPDIGFRVESQRGNVPEGRIVVRINGQWVEPRFSPGVRRLTQ
jgi:hypothetical protein